MNATIQDAAPLPAEGARALAPVKDRLTTTLFLAALFHGIVILGVTFALPRRRDRPTPTLEVLLLTGDDTRAADNPSAQYLAQRSQQGSGTTDERVRPANPASSALRRNRPACRTATATSIARRSPDNARPKS